MASPDRPLGNPRLVPVLVQGLDGCSDLLVEAEEASNDGAPLAAEREEVSLGSRSAQREACEVDETFRGRSA